MEIIALSNSRKRIPSENKLNKGGNWINYDSPDSCDNLLPQRILELTTLSPTNNGILTKKAKYTVGKGIQCTDELAQMFSKGIDYGDGLNKLYYKCVLDWHMYGGFCLQVVFHKNMKRLATIIHQDFTQVRLGFDKKKNDNGQYDQGVYICEDWQYTNKFKPKYYKLYDWTYSEEPTFLYVKNYTTGRVWYPLPDWFSAFKSVESEGELINYDYNNIINSFDPSGILKIPSHPDPEVERLNAMKLANSKGPDNAGKTLVVSADGEKAIEWIPMSNSFAEKDCTNTLDRVRQNIIIAHQLPSPLIIGLPGGASLSGDGNTIQAATDEFFNSLENARVEVKTPLENLLKVNFPENLLVNIQ